MAEYKFVIRDHAIEVYAGIVALLFTILGATVGRKLTNPKQVIVEKEVLVQVPAPSPGIAPIATDAQLEKLGISKREYEILLLMAEGLSNQEIAEKTYVSLSTIKTHVSNILLKTDSRRRTQAVTRARELHLLS
jgi:two-component system, NarL family, response regulator LiaR